MKTMNNKKIWQINRTEQVELNRTIFTDVVINNKNF